jgi:hypothetical protein
LHIKHTSVHPARLLVVLATPFRASGELKNMSSAFKPSYFSVGMLLTHRLHVHVNDASSFLLTMCMYDSVQKNM